MTSWRLATPADRLAASHAVYMLERCPSCGTATVASEERAAGSGSLYRTGVYSPHPPRLAPLVELVHALEERDRMRFLAGLPSGARVFEIGSGEGRFLARLARAGFEARGLEPAPERAERALARGLAVERAAVEEAQVPEASQDAVVAWHVLEHLGDPGATLGRVRDWLKPRGRIVVAVPNLDSVQARIGGDRWFHQDVPRHLTQFTAAGLGALLGRTGFEVRRISHLLVEHNLFGMWQTLLNRLTAEPNVVYRLVKGVPDGRGRLDRALVAVAGPPLLLVAGVVELAAGLARHGGTIVAEAGRS